MLGFIGRHLDPADRLGEVLFGLIMALGITGAVRLGHEEADCRTMLIAVFGCNLAWAVVDGVIFALMALFERGRRTRLARDVRNAPDETTALERIARELDGPLTSLTTDDERRQLHGWVLDIVRRAEPRPARMTKGDLLGGLAAGTVILLATLPVVAPFLLLDQPYVAVRVSNAVAIAELFIAGAWWGRVVGANPWRVAAGLTLVAVALVAVTIALGG